MTVRILCLVLFVSMMLGVMPISALAEIVDDTVGETTPDIENGEDTIEPDDEDNGIPDYSNPISVTSADELENALSEGSSAIRIEQGFLLDRTFYVVADTVIIADEPRTLTRAADFGGDIFVVGENNDGTATIEPVIFTLGKPDETTASMIVIDGNSQNMTADVVGTVVFVRGGSRADLYHNVTMTNHVKVGNAKTLNAEYSLSYPPRIGGAVAIVSSKAEMRIYGGLYESNRVNDITDSSTDEGTTSSQGGVIYNYGRLEVYGGTFTGNHAGRGGVIIGNYDGTSADGLNLEIYTNGNPRLYYKVGKVGYSYVFDVDVRSEVLTHIAITIDGLIARLYVNGELAGEATLTVTAPSTLDFNIGNDKRTNSGQYFKGTIYSVALFEDVRTAEEIKADALMVTESEHGVLYLGYFKPED